MGGKNAVRIVALILIVVGILALAYGGFSLMWCRVRSTSIRQLSPAFGRKTPSATAQTRWIATSMLPRVAFEYGQIC
jgi:hypothetical protein